MSRRRVVVTGGGGFVGRALIRELLDRDFEVVSISRGLYPFLHEWGVKTYQIDLGCGSTLLAQAFEGAEAVFHVAAKVDMWGAYQDFFRANVLGTREVLAACKSQGVSKLILTSSPSVVAGGEDLLGVNESYPYPERYLAHYPETKALAEREVLAANGKDGLRTLALRPHLIWGPNDVNLIPTVVERARAGRLIRIGNGENLSDFTYIDECVDAHLCALEALDREPHSAGKAYFISQGEPVKLWWWVDQILGKAGLPVLNRSLPRGVAEFLASLCEFFARVTGSRSEPLLTRFLVKEMATSHYFDISLARTLLGYAPKASTRERLEQFSFREAA